MKTGVTHLPLHYGRAPRWLFDRMKQLARQLTSVIVIEFGADEMLKRLSDPFWFQAFGCALGFDWHSSGLTTTVGGALKEGVRELEHELGFYVAGGKGGASRKTPAEIRDHCGKNGADAESLVYASRLSAKVDSAALQDGFSLYHHNFFFSAAGNWCVVQQGMNEGTRYARRYHWLGDEVRDFVSEPHAAICSDWKGTPLNMVAEESGACREVSAGLARQEPEKVLAGIARLDDLFLPRRHCVNESEDINPKYLHKILLRTYEKQPVDFKALLMTEGVGPKTIRALSLVSELVYGEKPSFRDPVRFSFAHGGKDGHPYPVDRPTYDQTIEFLRNTLSKAKIDRSERLSAFRRLSEF